MSIDRARPTSRKLRAARWAVPAILLALALATPLQALAADPPRSDPVGTIDGKPARVAESINLYRSGTMVKQYTNYWCVPATTQSMVNLVRGTSNRSYETQAYMYKLTRQHNRYRYPLGNDPQGWAWAATYFSRGEATYEAKTYTDRAAAVREIAASIKRTKHPVGVTVRKGTHAWVVLGFKGDVIPGDASSRRVYGFYVSGPLGSPTDPWTVQYWSLDAFFKVYTPYHEWQYDNVPWEGKYVVISD